MASISLKNICKKYSNGFEAVKNFNMEIEDKEFIIFVGPSGCGKSTTLRMVAGLEDISSGELLIDGKLVNDVEPKDRDIAMVFQNYALYPHMTVYENMAFALKLRKTPPDEIDKMVHHAAKILDLEKLLDRKPKALSGGQRQRVAMGRAIVRNPKVFLMDEPLSNLDAKLRVQMRAEISKLHQSLGTTIIYVTHDQEEALTMSDKIVVMKDGEIQQVGSPTDIYNEPVNEFVAKFIGESNIIDGIMIDDYRVMFEDKIFDCVDYGFDKNEKIDVVIRPEDLDIVPRKDGKLKGIVRSVLFKGVHYETIVETKVGTSITVQMKVSDEKPVVNIEANEKMSANDFYLDVSDIEELTEATIVARADAQAWNPDTEELISIQKITYDIKPENGTYPVTFSTAAGTSVTINMIVKDENRVVNKEYQEEIFAVNFFKTVDELKESIALETDLKTWANASAWSLEDDTAVEITSIHYDFDPENIVSGTYTVTFATEGHEYMIDTTDKYEVGNEVGLMFQPQDIHIMKKG